MTKKEFYSITLKINAAYPNRIADIYSLLVYWYEYFKDCDYNCILSCFNRYVKNNIYPPTVADLLNPYNEGIERTENEIQYQIFRNIKPSLSRMSLINTEDECVDKFYEIMDSTPLNRQYPLAKKIGEELNAYRLEHEGEEFDFNEWIKEYIHD